MIAEACNSYNKVYENIKENVRKMKSELICESEEMLLPGFDKDKIYPRYIIVREVEL